MRNPTAIAKAYTARAKEVEQKKEEVDEQKKIEEKRMIDVHERQFQVDDLVGGLRVVGAVRDHVCLHHRELGLDVVLLIDERLDERRVRLVG